MGQIKNIKLHIVTDIKRVHLNEITTFTTTRMVTSDYSDVYEKPLAPFKHSPETLISATTNRPTKEVGIKPHIYWCEVCKIKLTHPMAAIAHFAGTTHLSNAGFVKNAAADEQQYGVKRDGPEPLPNSMAAGNPQQYSSGNSQQYPLGNSQQHPLGNSQHYPGGPPAPKVANTVGGGGFGGFVAGGSLSSVKQTAATPASSNPVPPASSSSSDNNYYWTGATQTSNASSSNYNTTATQNTS